MGVRARLRRGTGAALLALLTVAPACADPSSARAPRGSAVPPARCAPDIVSLATASGVQSFHAEIADTPARRARGLMGRTQMAADAGMLFLYESPRRALFWMKDTPLPLDMIFADSTGTITHIHHNARPFDETPIDGGEDVLAVLEVNGGTAARLGLAEGQAMAHAALPQDRAAWPCAR